MLKSERGRLKRRRRKGKLRSVLVLVLVWREQPCWVSVSVGRVSERVCGFYPILSNH